MKPVGYDNCAASDRWLDDIGDELRAGSGKEQELGPTTDLGLRVEEQCANPFAQVGPPGLSHLDHIVSTLAESIREQPGLSALAGAVDSFEAEKHGDVGC